MDLLETILDKKEFKIPEKFKKYTIKKYEDSDYDGLMTLYNQVFPNYMSKKLWEWKNINNPFGNFFIIIRFRLIQNLPPSPFKLINQKNHLFRK